MSSNTQKKKSKRAAMMTRYSILLGLILVVSTWIAYNVFRNSVLDSAAWNKRAHEELQQFTSKIPPERGDILAADGTVLATTLQYYTLRIDFGADGFHWKGFVETKDSLAEAMAKHFPIKGGAKAWRDSLDAPLKRVVAGGKKPRGWRLINNVNYAQYNLIRSFPFFKSRKRANHGLLPEPMKRRSNPYGAMARLSIGIVSEDSKTGEVHGMSGLECALDSLLYGKAGVAKRVNFNRGIGKWTEVPAQRGWDVQSTIDIELQDLLENALLNRLKYCRAEWGTAVLMEVATGEIKAICNLEEHPKHPGEGIYIEAMNRAVQRWEPGSVVKPLSLMIAIEDGYVTDLDSVVTIGASYSAFGQGRPITDSHYNSQLTVAGCIEQSSNIGMARIMSRFYRDPQAYHDRIAETGFLDRLYSGIGEERTPRFPVIPLKAGGLVTLSRQFYGYGSEIPPLHTLSIYNAMANNGRYVRPRLVRSLHREDKDSIVPVSYIRERVCSEKTAKMMQQCLSLVVNGERGTARALKNPYVKLAGKTGTCYSVDPETHQYDTSRKRLAFCGYFPADDPQYSCVVLTFHPRENVFGAATTSGVVLRDMAIAMYSRGMLGNVSDFRAEAPDEKVAAPKAFASLNPELHQAVERTIGQRPSRLKPSSEMINGLPNVSGMGLREAIATLESHGLEVSYSGSGHVINQHLIAQNKIHLTLQH